MIFPNCLHGLLCFAFLSCYISEADARFSNMYSNLISTLNDTKSWISDFVSEIDMPELPFNSFTSLYLKSMSRFIFVADEVVTNAYDNLKFVLQKSDDFLSRFTGNASFWYNFPFPFRHNCDLIFNITAFDLEVKKELYGQHLVIQIVIENLKRHISDDNPKKPLVMSFHGQPGCGKSFMSKMIANHLFKDGVRSNCVCFYHGSLDFPNENRKKAYQKKLLYEIPLIAHNCERALFIFEEIDKMVPGVIDILLPYLKFNEKPSYVDFRKSTFLFLSNSGSEEISEITYNAWFDGIQREDITWEEFSSHLEKAAYDTKGGLWHSKIVKENYIDAFVPFMPLEKKHVKQCILRELQEQNLPIEEDIVEKIANQLEYEPLGFELYSVSGCKKVSHKVNLYCDTESQ